VPIVVDVRRRGCGRMRVRREGRRIGGVVLLHRDIYGWLVIDVDGTTVHGISLIQTGIGVRRRRDSLTFSPRETVAEEIPEKDAGESEDCHSPDNTADDGADVAAFLTSGSRGRGRGGARAAGGGCSGGEDGRRRADRVEVGLSGIPGTSDSWVKVGPVRNHGSRRNGVRECLADVVGWTVGDPVGPRANEPILTDAACREEGVYDGIAATCVHAGILRGIVWPLSYQGRN